VNLSVRSSTVFLGMTCAQVFGTHKGNASFNPFAAEVRVQLYMIVILIATSRGIGKCM
jgi:hypothetical protein